jgi:aminoglycoside phosphotransferase (APT) family kinase protein
MELDDCLPPALRGPETTITRVAAGLSGAGVFRVEAGGRAYILKVAAEDEPAQAWRQRVDVLRAAAAAGVAPGVIHVCDERRAVLAEFVRDRGLAAWLGDPATRGAALDAIGGTLRRAHELPLSPGAGHPEPMVLLRRVWGWLDGTLVPPFVTAAVDRVTRAPVPDAGRPHVMSHNDVNPTNLVYDGQRPILLDWDSASPNDPFYDLAALAMFLRLDETACLRLVAAHDGVAPTELPARFVFDRRIAAAMCGSVFLHLARTLGHAGSKRDVSGGLAEVYPRLRAGEVDLATPEGRWQMGLALLRESEAL